MLNLSVILDDSARKYSNKEAFIFSDVTYTYDQINKGANQVANGLIARGISKGDKVALSCLNIPYFPIIYFGILKAGAVIVPLSILLKSEEISFHLKDSEAKVFVCFEGTPELPMAAEGLKGFQNAEQCEKMIVIPANPNGECSIEGVETIQNLMGGQSPEFTTVSTSAEDNAVIIYTSGTTGRPKGAQLTHSNLLLNAILCADLFKATPEDKQLIVLPLFHIFAMTCLMNAGIYRGLTSVLLPRFEGKTVMDLMKKHRITLFAGVPTMYWGLLNAVNEGIDPGSISKHLRLAVSGGASLPQAVLEEFEEKFQVDLLEGFGMSEGSPVVTFNQLDAGRKANSVGKPVWGVEVKLVDENDEEVPVGEKGELIYKGHNVMKGYFNRPEANEKALKDGWLYSGDVAIKDEEGFYFIVDRKKDMIIRGGLNVYPREIEEVMMEHPAVSMVAIIGIPDDKLGEEVKACVVLKPGEKASSDELISWTKEKVAAYKYPRSVNILDALPTSATGKILKKELRKMDLD